MLKVHYAWCVKWKFVLFWKFVVSVLFFYGLCVLYCLCIICIVSMFVIFYVSYVLYGWCLICVCVFYVSIWNLSIVCYDVFWRLNGGWNDGRVAQNLKPSNMINFHYDSLLGLGLWISNNICIIKLKTKFPERVF
jgi:hypothetical protein